MATAELLTRPMTIAEFAQLPPSEGSRELIAGEVIEMNMPKPQHGYITTNLAVILHRFVHPRKLGRVFSNDAGMVTQRNPDSVRGPDVFFASFDRLPADAPLDEYLATAPELVCEVRSSDQTFGELAAKAAEYLNAGVTVVFIADPETETVVLHFADKPPATLRGADLLKLPEVFGDDFEVPIKAVFE